MTLLWSYFWPIFAAGLIIGAVGGTVAFRRQRGFAVALAAAFTALFTTMAIWHGPLGAAERFEAGVDRGLHRTLVYYEMTQVQARLHRMPLSRRVVLSGTADDFQRNELARLMDDVPGVSGATWSPTEPSVPLIVEALIVAVLGFLIGLLVAYLVELRRRYNAQWKW